MALLKRIKDSQESTPSPSPQPEERELLSRRPSATQTRQPRAYGDIKTRIQSQLIAQIDPEMDMSNTSEVRKTIGQMMDEILTEEGIVFGRRERQRLFDAIVAEILGYGPIQQLLLDDSITEVMVNGHDQVYIERDGKVEKTGAKFENDAHVMRIIQRIVQHVGRRIDEASPYVNARLPDGSRVNAIIPPLTLNGPTVTIRKFFKNPLTVDDLINLGTVTPEAMEFLQACVEAKVNILISGGTGSGKTTFLNVLSAYIPPDERIITIENAAELRLRQEHVVTLEARPPNIEGAGEVTIRDLVINSLRMRPDRIIVGECRGGEALDMLQAMNTGHEGSLTTAHSNSPRDSLARIETMYLMAGIDMPVHAIREQVASAIDLIVHQDRFRDGSRKVTYITEVQGMEGQVIVMQNIFHFENAGYEGGRVIGQLKPTGIRPKFMDKIEAAGIRLPANIFGIGERFRY
jgi:pilus assembly protein CpaF